jgi:histidinol-phosphate aminotransferase
MTEVTGQRGLRFAPRLLAAPAYTADWDGVAREGLVTLDRNESTRPVSPLVAEAIAAHVRTAGVQAYPTTDRLLAPLAGYCGVPPGCVLPTSGANQAIQLVLRSFLDPGGSVLMATPAFPFYGHVVTTLGATVHSVPFGPGLVFPYGEFRAAARAARPDVIVLLNPNNPTGTGVELDFVEELAAAHPQVPVVVDEAYHEYTGVTAVPLVRRRDNVLVLRSFSKAFAMAGLRLGYLVAAEPVVAQVGKLRNPFDVNGIAVLAGEAQLRRPGEVRRHVRLTMEVAKPVAAQFLTGRGVAHWPGTANFLLVGPAGGRPEPAAEYLRDRGVLVRPMSTPRLAGCFRVSVGTPDEMRAFCHAYGGYLDGVPPAAAG